jgi:hypothetical protein
MTHNGKPQQGTGAKLVMTITVNLAPIPSSSFRVRFILLCNRVIKGEKIYHFTKFINKKITTLKMKHKQGEITKFLMQTEDATNGCEIDCHRQHQKMHVHSLGGDYNSQLGSSFLL